MKSIIIALSLTSTFAMAETGTFTVKGMHCMDCRDEIEAKVCKGEAAKNAESCKVTLTDEKNRTGEVVLVTKPGTKIDEKAVEAGLKAAGTSYKITKVDMNDMVKKDLKSEVAATTPTATETTTTTTNVTTKDDQTGKVTTHTEKTKTVKKVAKKTKAPATTTAAPETK